MAVWDIMKNVKDHAAKAVSHKETLAVQEEAKKWGLSERRVQKLCAEGRIYGGIHLSRVCYVSKPADGRRKKRG